MQIDVDDLPKTRTEAWMFYKFLQDKYYAMGPSQWCEMERVLGRSDLFYLLVRLLRRRDLNQDWLFDRIREVQKSPDGHLDLWAREHGKSSIITFGLTIFDLLCDPDLTVGIFSHTRPIAKGFLSVIKRELESNDYLKSLYPDVLWALPSKESPKWSEDGGLILKRKSNPKEASIEAYGLVDGAPTGKHFGLMVYDDVVASILSPEMVEKTTTAWDLSLNLGTQDGKIRYIGTRYCLTGDARILMADWSHKPISDVQVGDIVVGWELRDGKRWLVKSEVKSAGMHLRQPVNRYTFSNGRSVVCTPDHKWWRGARWNGGTNGICGGQEYSPLGFDYHDSKHIRQLLVPTEQDDGSEDTLFGQLCTERLKLTDITDLGLADVHWIETETQNYVAEGFCSKNSLNDTYRTIIERGAAIPRIYAATHNGRMDGTPVFLPQKVWDRKLRDSSKAIIASQQLQNPLADDDAVFRADWLKTYEVRPRTLNVYILCDPSRGRYANSDATAMAVVGMAAGGGIYLLDGFCHRMPLSQRWIALRTLYQRWSTARGVNHIDVGYERFGSQSDDEYFEEQMRLDVKRGALKSHFAIRELSWPREGGNSKRERVERLEPAFRNGRFFLPSPILHNGKPSVWKPVTDPDDKAFGTIIYDDAGGLSSRQMEAISGGSPDLVAKAIIQRDPTSGGDRGQRYDLTAKFLEQYLTFPFGTHDDLIDAISRVYDMDADPPMPASAREERIEVFVDGV